MRKSILWVIVLKDGDFFHIPAFCKKEAFTILRGDLGVKRLPPIRNVYGIE